MPSYSQLKKRLTQTTWHHSMPTAARERVKGSADYSAPIQKARWLETRTQHLLLINLRERRNIWNESALVTNPALNFEKLEQLLEENFVATEETTLTNKSEEVSFLIAGYVAKQLHIKCDVCATRLSGCAADVATGLYFDILTRGGLTIPFFELLEYVSQCFEVLNYTDKRVLQQCPNLPSRAAGQFILRYHCANVLFTYDYHTAWNGQIAQKSLLIFILIISKRLPTILSERMLL